jgi:hypothetical protein
MAEGAQLLRAIETQIARLESAIARAQQVGAGPGPPGGSNPAQPAPRHQP